MVKAEIKEMQRNLKIFSVLCLLWLSYEANGQVRIDPGREKPFRLGEKLIYHVKFGPIVGGNASLELKQAIYNNKMVYHARGEGKTVGLAEKLYSVKDVFESYFDSNSILPYKAIRDVKEGNYRKHDEAIFNHSNNTVYSTRKDTIFSVPSNTLDMVSLLYYLRSLDLQNMKPGAVLHTVTFFDEELFPFDIRYKGKEDVKTKYGKIRCFRFDPVVEPGRMFESEDDMTIWISDDRNFIPVKVRFDLLVGSLHIELGEYVNLKYPLGIISK
jgi:hypothetical protein